MKAKEYFEKYFGDVDMTQPAQSFANYVQKSGVAILDELIKEANEIVKKRRCKTDDAVEGVIREQNAKWNSIANMVEKKYKAPFFKRNGVKSYWQHYLDVAKKASQQVNN